MTIKQFRENKGMTQGELAAALGTSQVAVSRWESGAVQPSAATLRKLAAVFDCQMDEIKPAARKLKAKDIFTDEAYEGLTAEERRYTLKVEQAKEYSGWRAYGTTMSRLMERIPDEWWDAYSAQHIGEVMAMLKRAYDDGHASGVDKGLRDVL